MKKRFIKVLASTMALTMAMTPLASASVNTYVAKQDGIVHKIEKDVVNSVDSKVGKLEKAVFGWLGDISMKDAIPTADEFEFSNFYEGGKSAGDSWKGGYAYSSIIPKQWRCDADGKQNDEGYNLIKTKMSGGYSNSLKKIFSEQQVYVTALSNGSDRNANGFSDLVFFVTFDGVGVTSAAVQEIRGSILESLQKKYPNKSITAEDIIICNVYATHCHGGIDTQGMAVPVLIKNALKAIVNNVFKKYFGITVFKDISALDSEFKETMCSQAAVSAIKAVENMETGKLYFFETESVNASDDLNSGVKIKDYFSNLLFDGETQDTIITNIGLHATSAGMKEGTKDKICADYPYYMWQTMQKEGYNLQFTQSSENAVYNGELNGEQISKYIDGNKTNLLITEMLEESEWKNRYGEELDGKTLDRYTEIISKGCQFSQLIINSVDRTTQLDPKIDAKLNPVTVNLDKSLMCFGATSGVEGFNAVKTNVGESGYGIVTEIGYLTLGDKVTYVFTPGELTCGITYGTDTSKNVPQSWQGKTSFGGKDWKYDSVVDMVRKATGDNERKVVVTGLTNDAIGYVFADTQMQDSIITGALFNMGKDGDPIFGNNFLLTTGKHTGSTLTEAFQALFTK